MVGCAPLQEIASDQVSGVASERLTDRLREIADGEAQARPGFRHCSHGVSPLYICPKCEERRWQAARELVLYDTLDRFSAAIERLAAILEKSAA